MTLLETISKYDDNKRQEILNLQFLLDCANKRIKELEKLLNESESLQSQYVLCCALHVSPNIMVKYINVGDKNET